MLKRYKNNGLVKIIKLLGRIELDRINSIKLFNEMGKKFMDNGKNKIIKHLDGRKVK